METPPEAPQRRSRVKRQRKGKNIVLSANDLRKILLPLYRHGNLPTAYVLAFRGGSYKGGQNRLSDLHHETQGQAKHLLQRIDARWQYINPNYRDQLYELGEKGEQELRNADLIGEYRNPLQQKARMKELVNLPHSVMISTTTASLELAVMKDSSYRFYSWDDVIERMGPEQQAKQLPFAMPVSISYTFRGFDKDLGALQDRTEHRSFDMIPDGICVIKNMASGQAVGFTIEAENRKQAGASNLTHTSFLKTFLAYRDINKHSRYEKLGLNSLMVLVVTRSKRKVEEMKKIVMQATDGGGSAQFLFRDIPVLGSPDRAPKPDDTLFTGPWERAGYPAFYISTFSDQPKK